MIWFSLLKSCVMAQLRGTISNRKYTQESARHCKGVYYDLLVEVLWGGICRPLFLSADIYQCAGCYNACAVRIKTKKELKQYLDTLPGNVRLSVQQHAETYFALSKHHEIKTKNKALQTMPQADNTRRKKIR